MKNKYTPGVLLLVGGHLSQLCFLFFVFCLLLGLLYNIYTTIIVLLVEEVFSNDKGRRFFTLSKV